MPKITGSNVTVMVKDMDTAIRFYEQVGLKLQQRWDNHYAMLTTEGVTIGLHPSDGTDLGSGTLSIGFMVESADEAAALLDSHGIIYQKAEDGKSGTYVNFSDPYGTQLYFVQPNW